MDKNEKHKQRMEQRKKIVDNKIAQATEDRGVVVLLTGDGKGKSSSGFGTVVRSLGHGYKVGVVQFIKGAWQCGELDYLAKDPNVICHVMGTDFTWETQDNEADKQAADETWRKAEQLLADESLHLVLLDELTYALNFKWLDKKTVINAIARRPVRQNVIITGRGAKQYLRDLADTVSEVNVVKHAFEQGIKAQKGIEW